VSAILAVVEDLSESVLRRAGWTPDRRVDVAEQREALIAEGYVVWPGLLAFLSEYSGLTLRFARRSGREDAVWFDAARAARNLDRAWVVEGYEPFVGARLAPVGYAYSDHAVLLACEDGSLWGAFDTFLGKLGRTARDAIAEVVADRPGQWPQIPN
jgi:hypothetical protein